MGVELAFCMNIYPIIFLKTLFREMFAFDEDFNRLLDNAETKSMQQKKIKNTGKVVAGLNHGQSPPATGSLASQPCNSDTPSTPTGKDDDSSDEQDVAAARARYGNSSL